MVKIISTQDIIAMKHDPQFRYEFKQGVPIDVPKEHAEVMLKNKDMFRLFEEHVSKKVN